MVGSETSSDTTVEVFCGGSPCKDAGLPVDPHHCRCHLSSWIVRTIRWLLRWDRQEKSGVFCRGSSDLAAADAALLADSPLPSAEFLLQDLQWAPAAPRPQDVIEGGDSRSSSRVPRRLAREGIFLSEWSTSILCAFGAGCAFRRTTYRVSDHIWPSGAFGIPLNHPQFLEWVGVPESPSLLEIGPGQWLDTLSRDQAMAAAIQLHRDVCLMTKNLDIIDQYALSLQGTASKILESSIGSSVFLTVEVAAGALGPRVRRASVQMEVMGLWRPSLDPILLKPDI